MYESHFGFSGSPFALNPDPAFYFNSKGHGRALGYLQYGVMQGEGFIVITGEIGAGKTTLVRTLIEGLDRQKVLAAQIVSTQLESGELLQAIITAFGIPSQGHSKAHLIATLEAFFTALAAQGRHALLIVDEAQNLNEQAVEELRMLSNFQLGNHALLQSFLVGQPELRRLLESSKMEQLRQRVIASQHLGPLGPDETAAYIEHRLRRVGWNQRPAFGVAAFDQIYAWTGGVPRRINRLANRLLLAAYLENLEEISTELVLQTAQELRAEIGEASFEPLPLPVRAPAAAAPAEEPRAAPSPMAPVVEAAAATPELSPQSIAAAGGMAPPESSAPGEEKQLDVRVDEAVAQAAALLREIEATRRAEEAPGRVADPQFLPLDEGIQSSSTAAQGLTVAAPSPTQPLVLQGGGLPPTGAQELQPVQALEDAPEAPVAPEVSGAQGRLEAQQTEEGCGGQCSPADVETGAAPLSAQEDAEPAPQGPSVEEVRAGLPAIVSPDESLDPAPARRIEKPAAAVRLHRPVLLCLADHTAAALAFAALSRELSTGDLPVRLVLVSPGQPAQVWPWSQMERLLPTLDVGLDLGVPPGDFASLVAPLFVRMQHVMGEFRPAALLTLGSSDAVLAAALLARKNAVPLVRLDGGARGVGGTEDVSNAILLDQMADLLLVDTAQNLPILHRLGVAPERIRVTGGGLLVEALRLLWPEVTTPYGVFMRHAMPIYLGPTWSSHAGAGTPYGVVHCALESELPALRQQLRSTAELHHPGKWVWLLAPEAFGRLLALNQEEPELFESFHLLSGDGPRSAAERDRMDRAAVLLRVMPALADQLGVLRGASCLLADAGDALAEAAELMGVPCLRRQSGQFWLPAAGQIRSTVQAGPTAAEVDVALKELMLLQPTEQLHDLDISAAANLSETAELLRSGLRRSLNAGPAADPVAAG